MATSTKSKAAGKKSQPWAGKGARTRPATKYSPEMKKQLIDEVKRADKAGVSRSHVFEKLAKQWTEETPHEFTEHQVSSQFHLVKRDFGYDVRRVAAPGTGKTKTRPKARSRKRRKLTAAPTRSEAAPTGLHGLLSALESETKALIARAEAAEKAAKAAQRRAEAAERKLARLASALQ